MASTIVYADRESAGSNRRRPLSEIVKIVQDLKPHLRPLIENEAQRLKKKGCFARPREHRAATQPHAAAE